MVITDAQVHIWAADSPERPWPRNWSAPHYSTPLTAELLLSKMDMASVDRAVIVPPGWEGDRNDIAFAAAQTYPQRLGVMGRVSLDQPNPASVIRWRDTPGMLGIRVTFSRGKHRAWLTDGTADWFWAAAEAGGIPVMAYSPAALQQIATVATRHPDLKIIVDHLGLRTEGYAPAGLSAAIEDVLRLAKYPNVAVKASGLPSAASTPYPYPDVHMHLERVVREFGRDRVMWASDLTRLPCTYKESVTMFNDELSFLSETDKEWIMHRTASEWLGWAP